MKDAVFPIFRKEHASGSKIEYAPSRGGIVTSLVLGGEEIFYLDQETFRNPASSVRGGIPILFPNAGELRSEKYPELTRHGFARGAKWDHEETKNGFKETFSSNEETRKSFPYDFSLEFEGELLSLRSARFVLGVINTGDQPLPLAMGLHPYFRVPASEKKEIVFSFPGGEEVSAKRDVWTSGGTVSIANPGRLEIRMPHGPRIILTPSLEYKRIWIWSEAGKDFVCIEPAMREQGGIVSDPKMILPSEKFSLDFEIGIEG